MGDNSTFSPEIWADTLSVLRVSPSSSSYDPVDEPERISIEKAARMRWHRITQGPVINPEGFHMSSEDLRFSAIETALYLRVFGEGTGGGARTKWVRVMFGESFSLFSFIVVW